MKITVEKYLLKYQMHHVRIIYGSKIDYSNIGIITYHYLINQDIRILKKPIKDIEYIKAGRGEPSQSILYI